MSANSLPKGIEKQLDNLQRSATIAVDEARRLGVEDCQVYAGSGERSSVRVRNGEIDMLSESRSASIRMRVLHETRAACSSTNDLRDEAIREFVRQTIKMAELAEPDPLAASPEPNNAQRGRLRDLEEYDPAAARFSVEKCIRSAKAAEKAALAYSPKISNSDGSSCARSSACGVLLTGSGFLDRGAGTTLVISSSVIADDDAQKKRLGRQHSAVRFVEDLADPKQVGREAGQRAIAQLGTQKMQTGRYPIVFDREAAAQIIGLLVRCVVGGAIYRGRSYLATKLGELVASEHVNIIDDPWVKRGFGSRLFDAEGQRCQKRDLVEQGRLRSFLLDTYSARKLKMESTASASGAGSTPFATASNVYLKPSRKSPESLYKGIREGLFVTDMMGFGFDPVTGTFSRGAEGFRIADGALAEPIGEITISRNLDELLKGIDAVANDLVFDASIISPSFRVDEMTVSGI